MHYIGEINYYQLKQKITTRQRDVYFVGYMVAYGKFVGYKRYLSWYQVEYVEAQGSH